MQEKDFITSHNVPFVCHLSQNAKAGNVGTSLLLQLLCIIQNDVLKESFSLALLLYHIKNGQRYGTE